MRRIVIVFIVVACAVTASPTSAWAASMAGARTLQLRGEFLGGSSHQAGEPCGGVAVLDFAGYFSVPDKPQCDGVYDVDVCVTLIPPSGPWTLSGDFEIITGNGVRLYGSVSGVTDFDNPWIDPFTLTVERSTGERRPVRGTIRVVSTYGGIYTDRHEGTFTTALHYEG